MQVSFYIGIVEDRKDPLKLGRYRVRVFGCHTESLADIPTTSLPWAIPLSSSASMSCIGHAPNFVEGSLVYIFFQDEESKQMPIIVGSIAGVPVNKLTFPGGTVFNELIKPIVEPIESIPPEEPPLAQDIPLGNEDSPQDPEDPEAPQVPDKDPLSIASPTSQNAVREKITKFANTFSSGLNPIQTLIISKYIEPLKFDALQSFGFLTNGRAIQIYSTVYIVENIMYLSVGSMIDVDIELLTKHSNNINLDYYISLLDQIITSQVISKTAWTNIIKTKFPEELI